MEIKNEPIVEIKDEDIQEEDFTPEELAADTTDWKAKALENKGISKRRATQLAKAKEQIAKLREDLKNPKPEPQDKPKNIEKEKSGDLDLVQETYLIALGIKGDNEIGLAKQIMKETGRDLREVVNMKHFQSELTELREKEVAKAALPSGSERTGTPAMNTVAYWQTKIENGKATLMDIPDVKLRRQVLDAKYQKAKGGSGNHFTSNPFGTVDIGK